KSSCRHCAEIFGALAVALSVLSLHDPGQSYWWSIGPFLASSALAAALNWQTLGHRYLYAAGILFHSAFSIWWILFHEGEPFDFKQFLEATLVAVCLSSLVWLCLELRARRLREDDPAALPFHSLAAIGSLAILTVLVSRSFSAVGFPVPSFEWVAFGSLFVLLAA